MGNNILDILEQFKYKNEIMIWVCDANPLSYFNKDCNTDCSTTEIPFSRYTIEERSNPKFFLESAESIFVVGVGYGKKYCFLSDNKPRGLISQHAVGIDYHVSVTAILNNLDFELKKYAEETNIPYESKLHVDTGPLQERYLAVKAGLGFIGKNGNLISEKFGSLFNIGCLVTSIPFSENWRAKPIKNGCGNCMMCIKACPSGALSRNPKNGSNFDYNLCISYLTQAKKSLSDSEKRIMGNHLYGCDICQNVCKYNINKHIQIISDIELAKPDLNKILSLSKKQFSEIYGNSAIFWRGHKIIKRNAEIALQNITSSDVNLTK